MNIPVSGINNNVGYPTETAILKFAKWGNSLAIRIPAHGAEKLGFRPGESAQFAITKDNKLQISRDRSREEAIAKMRALRVVVPGDFKFDRDEIYDN